MATIKDVKVLDLSDFKIGPVSGRIRVRPQPAPLQLSPLGVLAPLLGHWKGTGFNQIWRPRQGSPDHFLQLNETTEELQFVEIPGEIPNRGLMQDDVGLRGMTYLQLVKDAHVKQDGQPVGIHIEPGIWLNVPLTSKPKNPATVARLGNVPHGTAFLAQGSAKTSKGPPLIPVVDIKPFLAQANSVQLLDFPEQSLQTPSVFRTAAADIPNVTQEMVDNPNAALMAGLAGKTITSTTTLHVSGGGNGNIDFLQTNARSAQVEATFWIEEFVAGGEKKLQLQYSQRVILEFKGVSWPHCSVATLVKQ